MLAAWTGLAAGVVHVLSGPDHLAAVAPLAAQSTGRSWREGVRWGIGHSGGVALVGLLLMGLREVLPLESLSGWAEATVGVTLLGIGAWTLRHALSDRLHAHRHQHGDQAHVHVHCHVDTPGHPPRVEPPHHHSHAALAVGTLHGLAGSSHFFAVLPALALPSLPDALQYLVAYAAGTVVAMGCFAEMIGAVSRGVLNAGLRPYRATLASLSFVAMGTGVYWIWTAV